MNQRQEGSISDEGRNLENLGITNEEELTGEGRVVKSRPGLKHLKNSGGKKPQVSTGDGGATRDPTALHMHKPQRPSHDCPLMTLPVVTASSRAGL